EGLEARSPLELIERLHARDERELNQLVDVLAGALEKKPAKDGPAHPHELVPRGTVSGAPAAEQQILRAAVHHRVHASPWMPRDPTRRTGRGDRDVERVASRLPSSTP